MIGRLRDYIGHRGELICDLLLTSPCNNNLPIFKAQFLGDKFETLDFLVILEGAIGITPFFFVQVRTTREGYTEREGRLKVKVSAEEMQKLRTYPVPTYIIGIDESNSKELIGYIVSASTYSASSLSSLSTQYPLNCATLQLLWDEVSSFWNERVTLQDSSLLSE